jgi:hypothetical protein
MDNVTLFEGVTWANARRASSLYRLTEALDSPGATAPTLASKEHTGRPARRGKDAY